MARRNMDVPSVDKKWQTEDDLRTIRRAGEIKASAARMRAVRTLAAKEQAALAKVSKPRTK